MILNGKRIAENIYQNLEKKILSLKTPPTLGVVLVGENPASLRYINQKRKAAEKVGMNFSLFEYSKHISEENLLYNLQGLNKNTQISGYLIQLPLPKTIDPLKVQQAIDPRKDVDGFHPINQGKVVVGDSSGLVPCTPAGIMKLFEEYHINLSGKSIVILGRSNIVGKPLANLCINAGATVTSCNSQTPDISKFTKTADIIVSAVGKAGILNPNMVRSDAVIIDVGFSVQDGKILGDCQYTELISQGNSVTPVPGGVGPMTVAMLLENTYKAHITNYENS